MLLVYRYAGVVGSATPLQPLAERDDLAHPIAAHLRSGDWLVDWCVKRLQREASTKVLGDALAPVADLLKVLPRATLPTRVAQFFAWLRRLLEDRVVRAMPKFVRTSPLTRRLAIASGSA